MPIDWIGSEPEVCFVFLKYFTHQYAHISQSEIRQICDKFAKLSILSAEYASNERLYDIVRTADTEAEHFEFEIEELHGEKAVMKRIKIPTKINVSLTFCAHFLPLKNLAHQRCRQ